MENVLITGGSGFFGKAFARRALSLGASRVCIYSRNEYAQHLMRNEFCDDPRLRWLIGDVRDEARLCRAMDGVDTVIHAAALKRVEVGEYCPDELIKTNIDGAMNVISAAMDAGVQNVVALSTDKAAAPYNAYGASKLMAEKLFLAANNMRGASGPRFGVTRYGNVSGSTGSVIPIWRKLLSDGKKLTVTNPEATRFWMTVDEAVDLVLWTVGKEWLVVPDLPAYRVADLAEAIGGETETVGMRDGEKKHEAMISEHEMHEFVSVDGYFVRGTNGRFLLPVPLTSDRARRMTVKEIREKLASV